MDHIKFHFGIDPSIDRLYLNLITENLAPNISRADLLSKFTTDPKRHVIHGFLDNGRIVAANTFIKLKFNLSDVELVGYQSCFSATARESRGRGLWPKLMALAEFDIFNTNAAFIFGFPNDASFPIFKNRLHYNFSLYRNYFLFPKMARQHRGKDFNIPEDSIVGSFEDLKSWKCTPTLRLSPWANVDKENQVIVDNIHLSLFGAKLKLTQILAANAKSPLRAEEKLREITDNIGIKPLYAMLPVDYRPRLFLKIPASNPFPAIIKWSSTNGIPQPTNRLFLFRGAMDIS
jgi:hypothetical protein